MTSSMRSECWDPVNSEQHLGFRGLAVSLDWAEGQSCPGVNPSGPPFRATVDLRPSYQLEGNVSSSIRTVPCHLIEWWVSPSSSSPALGFPLVEICL